VRSTAIPWLFAGEARAWAALGNATRAKELIERAERAREQAQPDELDSLGGVCTFSQPRQLYYAARAFACIPDESHLAERYSTQAVDAYRDSTQPDWDFTCQADSRLSLALSRAARELDGVADSLQPVFDLSPECRIHDLVNTMNLVHRMLNRFAGDAEARNLQEAIETFTRDSLPRFPV